MLTRVVSQCADSSAPGTGLLFLLPLAIPANESNGMAQADLEVQEFELAYAKQIWRPTPWYRIGESEKLLWMCRLCISAVYLFGAHIRASSGEVLPKIEKVVEDCSAVTPRRCDHEFSGPATWFPVCV